jgi:hypothetical protein
MFQAIVFFRFNFLYCLNQLTYAALKRHLLTQRPVVLPRVDHQIILSNLPIHHPPTPPPPIGWILRLGGVVDGVFSHCDYTTNSQRESRIAPDLIRLTRPHSIAITAFGLTTLDTTFAIRPSLLQAFGGAVAPRIASRLSRRYLANTMTTTEMTSQTDGEMAGLIQSNGNGNGAAQENGRRRKLHGRAFYESIGSPKLVLAPMVEQSEFVCLFKSILLHTEMMAN